jgi:hypothetical protein
VTYICAGKGSPGLRGSGGGGGRTWLPHTLPTHPTHSDLGLPFWTLELVSVAPPRTFLVPALYYLGEAGTPGGERGGPFQ